jgi:hypothetical protein
MGAILPQPPDSGWQESDAAAADDPDRLDLRVRDG